MTGLLADAAAQVADAFGVGPGAVLEGPPARGQLGQVWRLTTDGGSYAVKEWFAEPDLAAVAANARFSERARAAGVLTPRAIRAVDGEVVVRAGGTAVRLFDWVDLTEPTRALPPAQVGTALARLHLAAETAEGPVDRWFSTGVGRGRWEAALERVTEEGAPFADDLAALVDDLVAVEDVVEPPRTLRTCHRDLWADNVLGTADGRVCVVDFENAGPADPSMELAMVLFEFGDDDPGRARTLAHAYADAGGPGRVTRRGHFTMLVAEQAHIGQLACSRWVGAEPGPERDRLAAWFGEIPQDPVTLARIDRVLDAVR